MFISVKMTMKKF